jgi:DNA repair protein RecO (recombination protein O)
MTAELTEAFLLRATPYGEADLVVALLTRQWGRVSALARGARKSRRRFGGALDYFHLLRAEVRPGRSGLGRLQAVELLRPCVRLQDSVEAYWAGSHVLEVARLGSREGDADEPLFRLVEASLAALERGADPGSLTRVFQARALAVLGFQLPTDACPSCGRAYVSGGAVAGDSIRCGACALPGAAPLALGTLRSLGAAASLPVERLGSLRLSEAAAREAAPLLEAGLVSALGARPRSLAGPRRAAAIDPFPGSLLP